MGVGSELMAAGLVAGPAVGHLYANARVQARFGMDIRGGALLVGPGVSTGLNQVGLSARLRFWCYLGRIDVHVGILFGHPVGPAAYEVARRVR